ncbi:MAG TPA: ABC transporter permease subunit [Chitinophagales bacterium]|nr:ABC transporter permease subunit [Chitinophagales bacterium]
MLKYIFKRILIFIPTLFVISLVTFMLSVSVPGDPVEQILGGGGSAGEIGQSSSKLASERSYIDKRKELGLDLPIFYFSLSNQATPDTLYKIHRKPHKENLERLIQSYGNWPQIEKYYLSVQQLELAIADLAPDSLNADAKIGMRDEMFVLFNQDHPKQINSSLNKMKVYMGKAPSMQTIRSEYDEVVSNYQAILQEATPNKNYIPSIHFYGANNQYHQWIVKFVVGDFGISYQDGRPVKEVLWKAVGRTLLISILSIILTYLIAVPIGVLSAKNKNSTTDQIITTVLFILYSLPSFWVATLLITFFGGGDFFDWFPTYGLGNEDDGFWVKAHHLVLPLFCWTYGGLAFVSRQMRGSMINSLSQDYIRTSKAKGVSESGVLWKHAFKNSLLPIITLFASVFPLAISGSIVLEIIFSIPGMGKLAFDALGARNYPVVYTVVMFSAVVTMLGYLVADICYALVDPRISYSSKK